MFNTQVFVTSKQIPNDVHIIFVSDMYVNEYVGGAELTTDAIIASSPLKTFSLRSRELTHDLIAKNMDKFWVFGNFSQMNPQLIPVIAGNLKYSILEYDFKYCAFRSPEKHLAERGVPCDCHNNMHGKMISAFFYGAQAIFWMSEKQAARYHTMFPFLLDKQNVVLSSVFSKETLGTIKALSESSKDANRHGWIVLGSSSWIKGAQEAEQWCIDNKKDYEVVWNVSYNELLAKLSTSEGFVYLPRGGDTCPRMVIEAKLLGCKLHLNDFVLHKTEEWFATDDTQSIYDYLFAAPELFWRITKNIIDYKPTISGYLTTMNCISQTYPYEQCIQSMLSFCDEVIVVDGSSTDGTLERLRQLSNADDRVKVTVIKRDMTHPHAALFDGMQKAEARKLCTKEYCWQMDADEVVHENDAAKIIDLCKKLPKEIDIISLPVIEYWGSPEKVRCDINVSKWRLSRNKPHITHGVPADLRAFDENGQMYAKQGTDGCCMIHAVTGERLHHVSFVTQEAEQARIAAISGNIAALQSFECWFNEVVSNIPSVHHYSWINFERKIKLYRDTWQNHWLSLYNIKVEDTAANNMFFDSAWSDVTDEMIHQKALELETTGGHVFHRKFDVNTKTPWLKLNRKQPKYMA